MIKNRWILLLVIVITVGLLSNCGFINQAIKGLLGKKTVEKTLENTISKEIEKKTDKEYKVDVNIQKEDKNKSAYISISDNKGTSRLEIYKGENPPKDIPRYIPIYPGSKVIFNMASKEENSYSLGLTTPDSLEKVTDYYKKELAKNKWVIDTTLSANLTYICNLKRDKEQLSLNINKNESRKETYIGLFYKKGK